MYSTTVNFLRLFAVCGRTRNFLRLLADRIFYSLRLELLAEKAQFNFFLPLACSCGARTSCATSCACIIFGLYCNISVFSVKVWLNKEILLWKHFFLSCFRDG